ncbi:glycoside hydrolase domain-containing protein [Burkholderia contaminans]|uniref:glycoside hydrolase domain-containing protein n=1 Tax=Burkholderia contaminans TaxID=488447 RepID=UPI000F588E62|nr:glycoside hydrolase domain-containing protein [Burkholderia contaminans]RQT29573.1 glycoside hydrolase family 92 protein [Burkholderia contaminans]
MKNPRLLLVAALTCAALAACGGDDMTGVKTASNGAGDTPSTVPPTSGPSQPSQPDQPAPPKRTDMALTQFVNPLIGTQVNADSGYAGNVSPGAMVPFGMVNFGPNTPRYDFNGSGGYLSSGGSGGTIDFFSVTHLSGVGCPGQGAVAMLPTDAATAVASGGRPIGIGYSYADETAEPGYYKVRLANGIVTELSATARSGIARFTYTNKDKGFFSIDAKLNGNSDSGSTKVTANNVALALASDGKSMSGQAVAPAFCTPYGTVWNAPVYFYATFDKPLRKQAGTSAVNAASNGAATLQFDLTDADRTVTVKVGVSSVSVRNAEANLKAEGEKLAFDDARKNASGLWNDRLNTIQIDQAATPAALNATQKANLTKFYTALYRVFGTPTLYSDTNGEFRSMRQPRNADGSYPKSVDQTGTIPPRATAKVGDYAFRRADGSQGGAANHYTGFSLWDTYRSQAQLLALLAPKESSDMMQSLVVDGLQCGAFPHWVDGSDDSTPMAGDNALNVIAGAYKFGATDFDLVSAARLTKQSAFDPSSACNDRTSAAGLANFLTAHYLSQSDDGHSSSATIERVLSDRSAAAFLQALPASVLNAPLVGVTTDNIGTLYTRAGWWRNIFDYTNKVIAARNAPPAGSAPGTLGTLVPGSFHESTEPNYFWTFAQDWSALIDAIGGKQAAVMRLNTLFAITTPFSTVPSSGSLNGGESSNNLYIGNEPSFQSPWGYNWAGQPSGAQYVLPIIMSKSFTTARDGLPGNDDMGATSSWYVWAALGMFPVIPSEAGLALSTPQFSGITVWFGNGKTLRLESDKQVAMDSAGRPSFAYIQSLKVNGADYAGSWLPLGKIANGGTMNYALSATPTQWAAADNLTPPSGPNADYTQMTAGGASAATRMRQAGAR